MPIPEISLAQFNKIASGKYNAGFVDFATDAQGNVGLTKVNNHVTRTGDALAALQKACGVDALKMSDWGIREEELPGMAPLARRALGALFDLDPAPLSDDDVLAILKASYR